MRWVKGTGALGLRLSNAWTEINENLGRSFLQALGVILGVASVLGGLSISDSQRKRSDELFVKLGGFDKLNVQPSPVSKEGTPSALKMANLGLRVEDSTSGEALDPKLVTAVSTQKMIRARVRSAFADQERDISGVGRDYFPAEGYQIAQGRLFSNEDFERSAGVVILGSEAKQVFFPNGDALGQTIRVGDVPVVVVGLLKERVFRFRKDQRQNIFRWRNRIIALPATLVQRRFEGDAYQRLDRVTFKIPEINSLQAFSRNLSALLRTNHRQQDDFRLDDVAARVKKQRSNGDVYNIIFILSGVLSLLGGGLVNVNIQLASLKDRVREVGIKMAIGASGREIFKELMTEALVLAGLGSLVGVAVGVAFSRIILEILGVPLYMRPSSFGLAIGLACLSGFLFALYPALKASRLSPMEALRYD
jgi:ABC-type antimicrobial peptide transport system permease subunit